MPSIRRRIRPTGPTTATIYSESRGSQVRHTVSIDATTGRMTCSCEAFRFTKGNDRCTVETPYLWCRHCLQMAKYLIRKEAEVGKRNFPVRYLK